MFLVCTFFLVLLLFGQAFSGSLEYVGGYVFMKLFEVSNCDYNYCIHYTPPRIAISTLLNAISNQATAAPSLNYARDQTWE